MNYPQGQPRAADFGVRDAPVEQMPDGGVLIRVLRLSIDPAMRTWASQRPGRGEPLALGSVMRAYGVGEIVRSAHSLLPEGTFVAGPFGLRTWHVSDGSDIRRVVAADLEPIEASLGVVGHIGLTAHIGLLKIAEAKPGDVAVISSAAGAVGSVAAQIAKRMGCRVIAIASKDKTEWLSRTYGIDTVLDREAENLADLVGDNAGRGVDVFFDNTGGIIHDAVMVNMSRGGRVAICGTIAVDSARPGLGPRHERLILDRELTVRGFLQSHHDDVAAEALTDLRKWHEEGSVRLHYEVIQGIDRAGEALERLLSGEFIGKVVVSTEPDHQVTRQACPV
jgi:NADPH-dependent curcumin reductase